MGGTFSSAMTNWGEISINPPLVIEWTVDFLSLSEGTAKELCSPKFQFFDDVWQLKCYPKGYGDAKDNYVSLYLRRERFVPPSRSIVLELGIRNADGTVYLTSGCRKGVFREMSPSMGQHKFIERSCLMRDKLLIAPSGTMTFFCIPRAETVASAMTNKDSGGTWGEISINPPLVIEWTVDFLSLSEGTAKELNSPKFQFFDDMWQLKCYPKGYGDAKDNYVSLYLRRERFVPPSRSIMLELGIRNADGTVYFTSGCRKGVFREMSPSMGQHKFIERSCLMKDKLLIAPSGTMTFFCIPRAEAVASAMTNKDSGGTWGEISVQSPLVIEWKVDFLSLLEGADKELYSPKFQFFDDMWQLKCYPKGYDAKDNYVSLYLRRERFVPPACSIVFELGIRNADGTVYLTSGCMERVFREMSPSIGRHRFIERSCLMRDKLLIAPSGTMTFFCTLWTQAVTSRESETFRLEGYVKLSARLRDLFISGIGSDVTFNVPFFDSMFTHDMKENNSGVVTINDCVPELFEKLLQYLCSGSVENISSSNVVGLYKAADKYGIIPVKEQCVQFMMNNLSAETFCDVIALAFQYNERALIEKATSLFVNNVKEIIVGVWWLCFLKEYPVEANELYIKEFKGGKS